MLACLLAAVTGVCHMDTLYVGAAVVVDIMCSIVVAGGLCELYADAVVDMDILYITAREVSKDVIIA